MPGAALDRWPAFVIAGLLALVLLLAVFVSHAVGRRTRKRQEPDGLGALETMASGLLGLLLAFNFSIAQSRFEEREKLLVSEANAIGTTYLRCSLLDAEDRRVCRDHLRDYAALRIAAYDSYGRAEGGTSLASSLAKGERIQNDLWALVDRAVRASPDAAHALLMSALNDLIDLDEERRASLRITVPRAVSVAIMLACIGWALLLGYSSGAQQKESRAGWVVVSLLISVVFGVAMDLDRPRTGFVTTVAAERSMRNVLRMMESPPVD